jgi:cyclic pyranopterin phosphate synthase
MPPSPLAAPHAPVLDALGRPLRTLRLSVTDRCNLRCRYCMPEEQYAWLPREDLLSVDELDRLAGAFIAAGVDRIRITGGEPLLRPDLTALVQRLAGRPDVRELALTTNGSLLAAQAAGLKAAGLGRLTVSLDTLQPERFEVLTRRGAHAEVMAGLEAARSAGFEGLKLDTVVVRGVNDDELPALVRFARELGAEVRFIEYMDVAGATRWSSASVVPRVEILARLSEAFGPIVPAESAPSAPAERFRLEDGTAFGVIASVTAPFCRACDRSRLTADGQWISCLYATDGFDLRAPLRAGSSEQELARFITGRWAHRSDRGAEVRAGLPERSVLVPLEALRRSPHREMHTRGG